MLIFILRKKTPKFLTIVDSLTEGLICTVEGTKVLFSLKPLKMQQDSVHLSPLQLTRLNSPTERSLFKFLNCELSIKYITLSVVRNRLVQNDQEIVAIFGTP